MPGAHGFPREARITRKTDYDFVFQHGAKVVGRYFVCHVARRESQGRKLGLAVSRKVGPSVVRNRIKRLLREFFRTHPEWFAEGTQTVVVARPACAGLDFAQCSASLREQLKLAPGLPRKEDAPDAC